MFAQTEEMYETRKNVSKNRQKVLRRNTRNSNTRRRTWACPSSNGYNFNEPVHSDLAWRFVSYILDCWAFGRSDRATRKNFLRENPMLNIYDSQWYAKDFFAAARHAGLVSVVAKNENGEYIYELGPNFHAFTQGKLSRIFE